MRLAQTHQGEGMQRLTTTNTTSTKRVFCRSDLWHKIFVSLVSFMVNLFAWRLIPLCEIPLILVFLS
jgi:hypothetical protein